MNASQDKETPQSPGPSRPRAQSPQSEYTMIGGQAEGRAGAVHPWEQPAEEVPRGGGAPFRPQQQQQQQQPVLAPPRRPHGVLPQGRGAARCWEVSASSPSSSTSESGFSQFRHPALATPRHALPAAGIGGAQRALAPAGAPVGASAAGGGDDRSYGINNSSPSPISAWSDEILSGKHTAGRPTGGLQKEPFRQPTGGLGGLQGRWSAGWVDNPANATDQPSGIQPAEQPSGMLSPQNQSASVLLVQHLAPASEPGWASPRKGRLVTCTFVHILILGAALHNDDFEE
ncbi:hypothetical protein FOCC_FOCC011335, partial [Frankliniella occidentalis]